MIGGPFVALLLEIWHFLRPIWLVIPLKSLIPSGVTPQ